LPCDCRQGKIDIGAPAMRFFFFFCRSTNIHFEEKTYDASFVSLFYPKSHCTIVLSFALEVVVFLNYAPIHDASGQAAGPSALSAPSANTNRIISGVRVR
jgi:hypothetical protein